MYRLMKSIRGGEKMIKTVELKFGSRNDSSALTLHPSGITVFVGPNHSGKSLVLRELNNALLNQHFTGEQEKVVGAITFASNPVGMARKMIADSLVERRTGATGDEEVRIGRYEPGDFISEEYLIEILKEPNCNKDAFKRHYAKFATLYLSGGARAKLVGHQDGGDLQGHAQSPFNLLLKRPDLRKRLRSISYKAFGCYLVLDPTRLGQLQLRLSDIEPKNEFQEIGITSEAIEFHRNALPIAESSDGVKSFLGLMVQLIANRPSLLLIDEPEAFLHPSLAVMLGKELASLAKENNKLVFASSHSASFLMGCIQSGVPLDIVRLSYSGRVPSARLLPNGEILRLMRNPLLRSVGVVDALFHDFVVVTEADTDRAFYDEINNRLLNHSQGGGIPNCLFLRAQNKQTIHLIMKPLRRLGIPTACIVDIDMLKEGGQNFTNILEAAFVPEVTCNSFRGTRADLKGRFEKTGRDMKRHGGINILNEGDSEAAASFFDHLGEYGVFVVRGGEVESWLKNLGVEGHGPEWLVSTFEKMGEDPSSESYVLPQKGHDVWHFLSEIRGWLLDVNRKGIPS
jgi:predicted ATPase